MSSLSTRCPSSNMRMRRAAPDRYSRSSLAQGGVKKSCMHDANNISIKSNPNNYRCENNLTNTKYSSHAKKGTTRCDYLLVESKILRRWKRRWVVLNEFSIKVYDRENTTVPPIRIIFTNEVLHCLVSVKDDSVLFIELRDGDFLKLKCPIKARAMDWKIDILDRLYKKKK